MDTQKQQKSGTNKNPALKILNFSKFAQRVYQELNLARTDPQKYSEKLVNVLEKNLIQDNILNINGVGMQLAEGEDAFRDAINFLRNFYSGDTKSLPTLTYSDEITKSSDELLNLLILHDGIDMLDIEKANYDIEKRMNHYGAAFGELDELIDYGTFDPEYVVINLIVCDGDETRKERNIIFNENIKFVGLSAGLLPSDKVCTVLNFAEHFYAPGQLVPEYIIRKFKGVNYNNTVSSKTGKISSSENLVHVHQDNSYSNTINNNNNRQQQYTGGNVNLRNRDNVDYENIDNYDPYSSKNDIRRKNSAKNYRDKERRHNNISKFFNNNTNNNYEPTSNNSNNYVNNTNSSTEPKITLAGGNRYNNNKTSTNSNYNEIDMSKTMPNNTKHAQLETVNPLKRGMTDIIDIPDNVDSIQCIEKPIFDPKTNKTSIVVKKIIHYKDGNSETIIFKK